MPETGPELSFRPVTEETRADFEAVFSAPGGPKYCWCMAWRATRAELREAKGPQRREQILGRIARGMPVGLVAYLEDEPIGWISVAPKSTFRGLGGPEPQPDENIWSLTCMFVSRKHRGQGHAHAFIAGACDHARRSGASVLEAYPVMPDSASYRFMGFVPAFEKAGFTHVGPAGSRRHVMRLPL